MDLPDQTRHFDHDFGDERALDVAMILRVSMGDIEVPPMPKALLQLQKLQSEGASASAFVDVVAQDPALAVRCLRVANSARYARSSRVVTLHDAVSAVGTAMVVRIALAEGLAVAACGDGAFVELKDQLWRQAVSGAVLSSALAPGRAVLPDLAFVCGLLHDFGRLIAVKLIEDIASAAATTISVRSWADVVERYHQELGIVAAERWQLPDVLRECITTHDRPLSTSPNLALLELVTGVDKVVQLLESKGSVTVDDIAVASGFTQRESTLLWRALPSLPGLIASFTIERLHHASPFHRAKSAAMLAPPVPSSSPAPTTSLSSSKLPSRVSGSSSAPPSSTSAPAPITAETVGVSRPRRFEIKELTGRAVVLRGADGLTPSQVFCLRFDFRKPLEVWLRVTASRSGDGGSVVEASPFALTGDDAAAWWQEVRDWAQRSDGRQAA